MPARNLLRKVGNKSFIPLPPSAQLQRLRYIAIFVYLFFFLVISHCVIGTHVHSFSGKTLNYPTGQNFANSDAPQSCIMLADSKFGR